MQISLANGGFAEIDESDLALVSAHRWTFSVHRCGIRYARTKIDGKVVLMHRLILGCDESLEVDHRDGNGLNNRRTNLRPCTHQQNIANRRKLAPATSAFKGVFWETRRGAWCANIRVQGRKKHLGYFEEETEAARAYDVAAKQGFGEFARINGV